MASRSADENLRAVDAVRRGAWLRLRAAERAPEIRDYGLIGDCHGAALVSRHGSIDWYCAPRFDAQPCFGRLLDWEDGGHCSISPTADEYEGARAYVPDTMVLETLFRTATGSVRILDFLAILDQNSRDPRPHLIRLVDGIDGVVELAVELSPCFDFGEVKPWIRHRGNGAYTAVGGDHGLVIGSDIPLAPDGRFTLAGRIPVHACMRYYLSIHFQPPAELDEKPVETVVGAELQHRLEETIVWWKQWSAKVNVRDVGFPGVCRSALVLKSLSYTPTGAIIAAPTTSLPESPQGKRNWDYRFSWVRDAAFTSDSLIELGCVDEAYAFRRFIERSSAGSAQQLQTLYGIDGRRRQDEYLLDDLDGYHGAKPVRVGNSAAEQTQLDIFGEMLELSWHWHRRGHAPSDDYWRFLVELIDYVSEHWQQPDHGIWEVRGEHRHYVHSKVMCWSALNRGLALASELKRDVPRRRWEAAREAVRSAIEEHGYDRSRGVYVQSFGTQYMDGALLLLPRLGYVEYGDERMVRTADAIRRELDAGGLLRRYDSPDQLPGREGAFVACSFWLVQCLAEQGRLELADQYFERACGAANDLGLFAEEYDVESAALLGNFPQGLTHLSYIDAARTLLQARGREPR